MENKHKDLWEKYWKGETSVAEEKILFEALEEEPEDGGLKTFYSGIQSLRAERPKGIHLPLQNFPWQKMAAVMLAFLTVAACWWGYRSYEQEQEARAYRQVVEVMGKIQFNLKKGTSHLESMEKIKYLNSAANWYENDKNN